MSASYENIGIGNEGFKLMQFMAERTAANILSNNLPEEEKNSFLKMVAVFAKHGIGLAEALAIMKDLGEIAPKDNI